jgi:hypothetical protein
MILIWIYYQPDITVLGINNLWSYIAVFAITRPIIKKPSNIKYDLNIERILLLCSLFKIV